MMSGTISNPQPDELWRLAIQQTPLIKIRIFRDNYKSIDTRIFPNLLLGKPF
jgi:hypothetical protein